MTMLLMLLIPIVDSSSPLRTIDLGSSMRLLCAAVCCAFFSASMAVRTISSTSLVLPHSRFISASESTTNGSELIKQNNIIYYLKNLKAIINNELSVLPIVLV